MNREQQRRGRVQRLAEDIADKLDEIAALYKEPVIVTVIVRAPGYPDGSRDTLNSGETDVRLALRAAEHLLDDPTAETTRVPATQ